MSSKPVKLTDRQYHVLSFLKEYVAEESKSPTLKEIAEGINVSSVRTVTQHLDALEEKGYIRRIPNKSRNIRLIDSGSYSSVVTLPVISSVGCDDMTIEAQENYDEYMQVDRSFLKDRDEDNIVLIRAVGDSMVDAGVDNGDLILVERTQNVNDGDLVVVIIDDIAVLKRIEITDNSIILHPESTFGNYKPIVLKRDFDIFGKFILNLSNSPDNTSHANFIEVKSDDYEDYYDEEEPTIYF